MFERRRGEVFKRRRRGVKPDKNRYKGECAEEDTVGPWESKNLVMSLCIKSPSSALGPGRFPEAV